ncbi:hypothetical protein M3D15_04565 [Pseudoclavibacter alba]|uniref:Uncharacterized protein n=1 Tax=Pseudoclavibacter albus TaxID=272241 RepID=A0ABT2HWB4_9MICO|nr:hypothetical protein [Pseudoclavibacter alba]MCT2042608.1 hypothetical protein [Pseudoclavibacter alba]
MRHATKALKALLESDPAFAGKVSIGPAKVDPPYVVLWPIPVEDLAPGWTGQPVEELMSWSVVATGATAEQAMWADEHVQALLKPAPHHAVIHPEKGRPVWLVRDSHGPLGRDSDASPETWFVTSVFSGILR